MGFLKRWRALARPTLAGVVAVVAASVVVVTVLHVGLNSRRPLGRVAEARSLPVGGLPVT